MGATPGLCLISKLLTLAQGDVNPQIVIVPVTLFISYLNLFRHVKGQLINFDDKNFVDSKSSAKNAKITYLENLYVYGMCSLLHICL